MPRPRGARDAKKRVMHANSLRNITLPARVIREVSNDTMLESAGVPGEFVAWWNKIVPDARNEWCAFILTHKRDDPADLEKALNTGTE